MSNHYHILLRVDKYQAHHWDDRAVAKRWKQLYNWPLLVQKYLKGKSDEAETLKVAYKEPDYHQSSKICIILNSPPQQKNAAVGRSALYTWLGLFFITYQFIN